MNALPRGRHGLSREFIAENQRQRLLAAIAGSLDEHGYDRATVAAVSGRAGVSKSDFYRHFANKDECFFAAYDQSVEWLRGEVLEACAGRAEWAGGVCAGLSAALCGLAAEPAKANLLLVEGLRAGPGVYGRFQSAVESFVPYLREGAPAGTKSLALIVDDPDAPDPKAPKRVWVHWLLYNIPPDASALAEDADKGGLPTGTVRGVADSRKAAYGGPCPPIGRHRYFHKLYALDTTLDVAQATKAEIEAAMKGHVLAQAELIGTYQKGDR